jgi:biotin carboxyl carrier protein
MPGLVLEINAQEGQTLPKGAPLLILEAMKMENVIKAPADVVVKSIQVSKGDAVNKNQVLMTFDSSDNTD